MSDQKWIGGKKVYGEKEENPETEDWLKGNFGLERIRTNRTVKNKDDKNV